MGYIIDFLQSKLIVLPRISIPVNLTDFNLFINLINLHMKSTVWRQKNVQDNPPFKGPLTLAEDRQTSK